MAILGIRFRNISLGQYSKIGPATGVSGLNLQGSTLQNPHLQVVCMNIWWLSTPNAYESLHTICICVRLETVYTYGNTHRHRHAHIRTDTHTHTTTHTHTHACAHTNARTHTHTHTHTHTNQAASASTVLVRSTTHQRAQSTIFDTQTITRAMKMRRHMAALPPPYDSASTSAYPSQVKDYWRFIPVHIWVDMYIIRTIIQLCICVYTRQRSHLRLSLSGPRSLTICTRICVHMFMFVRKSEHGSIVTSASSPLPIPLRSQTMEDLYM